MIMKIKVLALMMALVIALLAFTACGGNEETTTDPEENLKIAQNVVERCTRLHEIESALEYPTIDGSSYEPLLSIFHNRWPRNSEEHTP